MLLNLKWSCFSIKIHAQQSLPMFKHLIESFWATISLHFWIVVYRGGTLLRPAPQDLGRITACASSAATHAASFGESGTGGAHASSCVLIQCQGILASIADIFLASESKCRLQDENIWKQTKNSVVGVYAKEWKGCRSHLQSPTLDRGNIKTQRSWMCLKSSISRSEHIFIQFYRYIVRRIPQSLVWYIMPSIIYKYHDHLTLRDAALWRLCLLATHRLPNCCAHVDSRHHHHQRPWPENIGHTFLSHS